MQSHLYGNDNHFHLVVLAETKTNTRPLRDRPSVRSPRWVPKKRRLRQRDRDEIVRLYSSGMSSRAVAAEVGVGRTTVLDVLRAMGIALRPRSGNRSK